MQQAVEVFNDFSKRGVHLKVLTMEIDTHSPMGKCMYYVASAFAEMERDILIERTPAGLQAARTRGRKGWWARIITCPLLSLFMTVLGDRFWFKIESFTWSSALNHQVVIIPGHYPEKAAGQNSNSVTRKSSRWLSRYTRIRKYWLSIFTKG